MIGDALWYPLWNEKFVESTAHEIAKIIPNSSNSMPSTLFVNHNNYNNSNSSNTNNNNSTSNSSSKDYTNAYDILMNAKNSNSDGLENIKKMLDDYGVGKQFLYIYI